MKKVVIGLICLLLLGTSARAWDAINVNFARGTYSETETGQGALGDGTAVWNLMEASQDQSGEGVLPLNDAVDSQGNTTSVSLLFTANSRGAWNADSVQSTSLPTTNGHYLMASYFTTQNAVNNVTIQGLEQGAYYNLYLFGHGDNETQNTQFTIGETTKGSTIEVTGLTELTEDAHYVVFSEVPADETGQISIDFTNGPDNAWGAFNGLQITSSMARGAAHTPVPTGTEVDSTTVQSVSWSAPVDENLVSIQGYDVYWSTTEPNLASPEPEVPVSVMQTGTTFNPTDFGLDPITVDTTYYWHVDAHVVWDSTDITGSINDIAPGLRWQFTTLPYYVAPNLVLDNMIVTLDLLPVDLTASVINNSDEITSLQFTLLQDDFEFPAGADASLTNITSDNNNPTASFDTDLPGTYKVNLVVSDGTNSDEKYAEIIVYSDACQAKKDSPSGWSANYFDINDDCIVNVIDFAEMAALWLDSTAMASSERYSGGPAKAYFTADIVIDSKDVYSLTDADYVSTVPLTVDDGLPRISTLPDALGGSVIGYTDPNDFVTYQVDIPAGQGGDYTVYVANAFPSGDPRSIALGTVSPDGDPTNDDIYAYGTIELSDGTGWGDDSYSQYKVDTATISFSEGTHLIRVTWIDGSFNLDYIALTKQ